MKKQILLLTFLSLAFVFAGVNNAYGQASNPPTGDGDPAAYINYLDPDGTLQCADVTELECAVEGSPLNPQAGQEYTYSVDVVPTDSEIHWFVTDETDIIAALNDLVATADPGDGTGDYILASGEEYNIPVGSDPAQTATSVNISWKSFDATEPVLLVTYVMGPDGCTDNIEVYRIEPVFNFTLDIAAIDETGTILDDPTDCVSPIESAEYDVDVEELVVDYGENWLFFVVTAANFADSWMPLFQVNYDGEVSDPIEVEWAYPDDATTDANWVEATDGNDDGIFESPSAVDAVDDSDAVGGDGECIVVRVRIDHGENENPETGNLTLTLGVNGTMYDPAADDGNEYANADLEDLGEGGDGNPCTQEDFDDSIDYILTPRPLIETNTIDDDGTDLDFEPKNP